jgi:hypothetical protein
VTPRMRWTRSSFVAKPVTEAAPRVCGRRTLGNPDQRSRVRRKPALHLVCHVAAGVTIRIAGLLG